MNVLARIPASPETIEAMAAQLNDREVDLGDERACLDCLMLSGRRFKWAEVNSFFDDAVAAAQRARVNEVAVTA